MISMQFLSDNLEEGGGEGEEEGGEEGEEEEEEKKIGGFSPFALIYFRAQLQLQTLSRS